MNSFRISFAEIAWLLLGFAILSAPKSAIAQRPLGIDVSAAQGTINWSTVVTNPVAFAWTKATETNTVDPTFTNNMVNAKAQGIPIGVYHVAHPEIDLGTAGADAEAAFFWSTVSNYILADGLTMMPVLNYTNIPDTNYYTSVNSAQWVNEWCQDLVNYGLSNGLVITPIVYTSNSFAVVWLNSSVTQWPLWIDSPNGRNPLNGSPGSARPWRNYQFWQYGQTNISGVPNIPNGDVFRGTIASLATYMVSVSPPFVLSQPGNTSTIEGGTVSFSVSATTSPLQFQWQFEGQDIDGATDSTFVLTNAQLSDAGDYSVQIAGPAGITISSNATLSVTPMIGNVAVIARPSSAIITWTTSTNASGQATYGLDTNYGLLSPLMPALTAQHAALIVGLQPSNTYFFQLASSNNPYAGTYAGSFSTDVTVIMQSSDASYSGVWTLDSAAPDRYSPFYEYAGTVNGPDTATAFFRPNIITSGNYNVYLWYSEGSNRSQVAPVTVGYLGGGTEDLVNETTNGGSWQLLAAGVPFAAGTNGYIRLGNGSGETGRVVISDAVMLVYDQGQDLPVNNSPPSWWLNYYFGTNSVNALLDSDGDGYSTLSEYIVGTDPTNPYSHLRVRGQGTSDGAGVQVIFSPYYSGGHQYQLQSRSSATNGAWTNLPLTPVTVNTNGEGVLTVTNLVGSQNYFRLSVLMTQ